MYLSNEVEHLLDASCDSVCLAHQLHDALRALRSWVGEYLQTGAGFLQVVTLLLSLSRLSYPRTTTESCHKPSSYTQAARLRIAPCGFHQVATKSYIFMKHNVQMYSFHKLRLSEQKPISTCIHHVIPNIQRELRKYTIGHAETSRTPSRIPFKQKVKVK